MTVISKFFKFKFKFYWTLPKPWDASRNKMADSVVPKRPFKICNSERNVKKGIVCDTLEELKRISCERFSLSDDCRLFLESDGTEVDNNEYLQFLPPQTLFMVTDVDGQWVKNETESLGRFRKVSVTDN